MLLFAYSYSKANIWRLTIWNNKVNIWENKMLFGLWLYIERAFHIVAFLPSMGNLNTLKGPIVLNKTEAVK